MDPFTQRMLERARARQEKIDQKLANSGQAVPKRKPLAENVSIQKSDTAAVKSPGRTSKETILSPKKPLKESNVKSPRRSTQKCESPVSSPAKVRNVAVSPAKARNDYIVTKKEFKSPRGSRGSAGRRNSDVSVEINIMHRNDIQIEVQVEERDAPIDVVYHTNSDSKGAVTIEEIDEDTSKQPQRGLKQLEMKSEKEVESHSDRTGLRQNVKSRLDRLGNLYSDKPNLSSPIHRTESNFTAGTPPPVQEKKREAPNNNKKKFGRLAALADEINNWEDDLSHHNFNPEPAKKPASKWEPKNNQLEKLESSTLDVSIHSIKDINKVLQTATPKSTQSTRPNTRTFTKTNEQKLEKNIVAELEPTESATPSAAAAPNMATMVAAPPIVTKKPSIKKYKAPTPPRKEQDECDSDKDKENTVQQQEIDNVECKQTKQDEAPASPVVKRLAPKLNGNVDRNSVLSKAAMFEAGSPRAKEKDPAEMSLRERKALFEKNKGAVIMPKAPFGLAPSVKTLHGDKGKPQKPATPTKPVLQKTDSKESNSTDDNISVSSLGGGIKDKLAALMNKEQTISEATIANKFKQERDREMEMLNNRFQYKLDPAKKSDQDPENSDDEHSDNDGSENAPLMGSTVSLSQTFKKPEVVANIPKIVDKEGEIVGTQPTKRRSSQDSPVVLSVLEDVKRIKVNNKKEPNGTVTTQPGLYPHLSDIETDNSRQDEFSDCGGSSSDNIPADLNKSENWAETSFGREVMNVVKKNRKSYKMAVRESDDSEISDDCDSDLDACIDEALDEHSEGPTPPKQNKNGALSSTSFVYHQERAQFKSPQKPPAAKTPATPATPATPRDKGSELVHSVSFYRRMQNALGVSPGAQFKSPQKPPAAKTPATPLTPATPRDKGSELVHSVSFYRRMQNALGVSPGAQFKSPQKPPAAKTPATPATPATPRDKGSELVHSVSFYRRMQNALVIPPAAQFKSPQKPPAAKTPATPLTPATPRDKGSELVHSVSFYRRMQNASNPSTPMRIIRHTSPERDIPSTPSEPSVNVTTVRQRIKELQQEIAKQQTVISQASQALNLCAATIEFSGSTEQAEGERLLLLATHRRQACLHEVQRLQVEGAGPAATAGMASLHINSLNVPLRRDYMRQLNADGAVGHHAVCLLKCRDRVLATSMQLTKPTTNILHFPDEIRMDGLTSDFKVTVEVYLLQASKEVLPHDVKYHISNKKSSSKLLTPKSKVSELKTPKIQSPAGPTSVRSPQFQLHGYCIFALSQASRKTFTLSKVPCGSPLDGSINIDIKARLQVPAPEPHAAFLTAFDDVSGLGAWHRRWFRLQPPRLAYWKYPDDVTKKMPIGDIDLTTVVSEKVVRAPRDLCARPNTLLLESSVPAGLIIPDTGSLVYTKKADGTVVRRHLLAADTPKDRDVWLDCLNRALEYVRCSMGDGES
ncbi:cell division protein anillin domain-containing protein [Phthorimaea operculella]|nr:cell division protein anillin domain-containing protein [Phthorimaea operculella]